MEQSPLLEVAAFDLKVLTCLSTYLLISDVDVRQSLDRCRSGMYILVKVGTGCAADAWRTTTAQRSTASQEGRCRAVVVVFAGAGVETSEETRLGRCC